MSTKVEDRMRLEDRLREVLGSPEAATLISYLPQGDPADLATKQDVESLRSGIRSLETAIDELRTGQAELRTGHHDLSTELREIRLELRADMMELRSDVRGDMLEAIGRSNRNTVLAVAGTLTGSVTIALAILSLAG